MELIDFTNLPQRFKSYGGANGNKLCVVIDNELYMLKLPIHPHKNTNLSYINSCFCEYLGSHIFNMLGFPSQETILGYYLHKGINRIAVACKDFETDDFVLKDFASLKNQIIDSSSNGYGTELDDILETIENQKPFDPVILSSYFWDMFVIDAFIGNWDRHNGNWGYLYNQKTNQVKLAPIFDCGSSLYPQIDDVTIDKCFKDKVEMNARIYNIPTSALRLNGQRINYYEFIKSHKYKECDQAIERLKKKIDFTAIDELIDGVKSASEKYRQFLKTILRLRYQALFN